MKIRALLVLAVAAAALAWGVTQLFNLRFSAGDVYPPYSSLRSDPLGCKALYETLRGLPGLRVTRNFRPLRRAEGWESGELFYLGASPAEWPRLFDRDDAARLDRFLRHGGRLTIAFAPTQSRPTKVEKKKEEKKQKESRPEFEDMAARWKIDFRRSDGKSAIAPAMITAKAAPGESIEPGASWHSRVDFELNEAARKAGWRPLYLRGNETVAAARDYPVGGRLTLFSDSYLFSNEALRDEPHPALLASLLGAADVAVFDETHFGVSDNPGWMALARRFQLAPAMTAAALLAALFLWMSAARFAPAPPEKTVEALAGADSANGFLNLVRRAAPPRELLATCVAEWERSAPAGTVARVRAILPKIGRVRDIPAAYREMCAAASSSIPRSSKH